jgi:hypothetical protein
MLCSALLSGASGSSAGMMRGIQLVDHRVAVMCPMSSLWALIEPSAIRIGT